jgi:sodium/hydrogen exchanger-like protein 6/7
VGRLAVSDDGLQGLKGGLATMTTSAEVALPLAIGMCVLVLAIGLLLQLSMGLLKRALPRAPLPPETVLWWALGLSLSLSLENGALPPSAEAVVRLLDDSFPVFFMQVLLPSIIFSSGVALSSENGGEGLRDLRAGFAPALVLAFLGTVVASATSAAILAGLSAVGALETRFSPLQCVMLSVALSATDTVCVLSLLRELRVPPLLFAISFGESVFNDAVTIVLMSSLAQFSSDAGGSDASTALAVLWACLAFVWGFVGSSLIGMTLSCGAALVFKHGKLSDRLGGRDVEFALLTLMPFLSFMIAEASGASGVVSSLVASVLFVLALKNVSPSSALFGRQLFHTAGSLAEKLTFLFLGVATTELGGGEGIARHWRSAVAILFACVAGRAAAVAASCVVVNLRAADEKRITLPMAIILWFAGLRGGVAFALAMGAAALASDDGTTASAFAVSTLFVVVVTMLGVSALLPPLVRWCGLASESPSEFVPTTVALDQREARMAALLRRCYTALVVEHPEEAVAEDTSTPVRPSARRRESSSRLLSPQAAAAPGARAVRADSGFQEEVEGGSGEGVVGVHFLPLGADAFALPTRDVIDPPAEGASPRR